MEQFFCQPAELISQTHWAGPIGLFMKGAESLSIFRIGLITERIEGARHQCRVEKLMLTNKHINYACLIFLFGSRHT